LKAAPASAAALFWAFSRLALQGFGGVLPVAQRELVERQQWLSRAEFLELLSVSQVLPGPNIVNMGLILGHRWRGWTGAVAATAGLLAFPLVIVLALAMLYRQGADLPVVAGMLRGMGAVAAGLVLATAFKLAKPLTGNPMGLVWCAVYGGMTLLAVGVWRWPLAGVVAGLGVAAWATAYRALASAPTQDGQP
jgi:chromate transporter